MPSDFQQFADDFQGVFDQVRERNQPVLVERDGVLYRVERADDEADIFSRYDPDRAREAARQSAGALQSVDREELLRAVYAQQEQDSTITPRFPFLSHNI